MNVRRKTLKCCLVQEQRISWSNGRWLSQLMYLTFAVWQHDCVRLSVICHMTCHRHKLMTAWTHWLRANNWFSPVANVSPWHVGVSLEDCIMTLRLLKWRWRLTIKFSYWMSEVKQSDMNTSVRIRIHHTATCHISQWATKGPHAPPQLKFFGILLCI